MYQINKNFGDTVINLKSQNSQDRELSTITSELYSSSVTLRLLYIDNSPIFNPSFETVFLQNDSFDFELEWTHAETLDQALQCLQEQSFEVILLSLGLSSVQGLEIFTTVKGKTLNIPILVITSPESHQQKLALQCLKQGAKDYLVQEPSLFSSPVAHELFSYSLFHAIERLKLQQDIQKYQTQVQTLDPEWQEKVTNDQLIHQRLKTAEAQMRGFLDAINDIVLILDVKTQDIQVVPTRSEVIYPNTFDIIQETLNLLIDDESSPEFWQIIERSLANKTQLDLEYCLSLNNQELWFSARVSPLSPEQVIWVARDISTDKQSQEQLQQQLAAIETAIDGIALLKDEKFIYLNSAHVNLFGYNYPEELLGKSWKELYSAAEISRFEREVFPQLAQHKSWRGEATATRKDGTSFAEEVSLSFTHDGTLICVFRDITERKKAEQEIFKILEKEQELSAIKSGFITRMSHEFRTPLAIISSSVGILESFDHKLSDTNKQKHFQKIQTQIQHITNLLDEILLMNPAPAEVNPLTFNPKPLNVLQFCQTLVQETQLSSLNTHHIHLTCQQHCQLHQVVLDEKLLQHILTHLLSNAIKYSPDGSKIDFCLNLREDWIRFQIRDFGIGIPVKEQKQVFQSFYRAQNVGTIQGTGLGLSIVKKCLDLHSGRIRVESLVDEGTTFTVKLPLKTEEL